MIILVVKRPSLKKEEEAMKKADVDALLEDVEDIPGPVRVARGPLPLTVL